MTVSGSSNRTAMKRLATYLPDPIYEALEKWADQEKRSMSNLAAFLLEQVVREHQRVEDDSTRKEDKREG